MYRRYDIDPHQWKMDLGFLTHIETLGYSLRQPRRREGFTLHHDINPYRNLWDKNNETNVSDIAMDLSAIQSEEQNLPVGNSDVALDMSVTKSSVPDNASDNINEERNATVSNFLLNSTTQSALDISQPDTVPLPTVNYANDEQQKDLNVNEIDKNSMEVSPNDCNNVNIQVDSSVLRHQDMETDQSMENVQAQKEVRPDTTNTDSGIDLSVSENVQNSDSDINMQQGAQTITNTSTMDGGSTNMDTATQISTCDNLQNTELSADITVQNGQQTTTDINNIIGDTGNIDSGIDMSTSESLQSNERPVSMPVPDGSQTITEGDNNIGEPQNNDLPQIQDKVSQASEDDETSGNVELSEFEETVDYGADSTNEQSTQETDSPVESTPKSKPDWSLRPPLITPTNNKDRVKHEKLRCSTRRIPLPKIKPKRIQPRRATKATVSYQYEPCTSDSESDVSSEIDNKDQDYIPDGEEGKLK